jgi:diacylglycerol kinase family enzyme
MLTLCARSSMRITLIHNPKAGHGKHKTKELIDALAKSGYHATYRSTKKTAYKRALEQPTDWVIAAGGDGTIEKIASRLINSDIPLSVLPLGTANNVARNLGFVGSAQDIIAGLREGKERAFDVGLARGPWGERCFFEGAGGGLLADYVRAAKRKHKKAKQLSKKREMTRHISRMRQILHDYPARKWKIEIDGEDISDRYIMWEALNTRSVGPALPLARRASTKDGRLDLVCVGERDRSALIKYLDARLAGQRTKLSLPIRRFRKLKISSNKSTIHIDDRFWPRKKQQSKHRNEIEITVKPSALVILEPAANLKGLKRMRD